MGQDIGCHYSSPNCLSTMSQYHKLLHPYVFTTYNQKSSSPTSTYNQLQQKLNIFKNNLLKNVKNKNTIESKDRLPTSTESSTTTNYKNIKYQTPVFPPKLSYKTTKIKIFHQFNLILIPYQSY